VSGHTYVCKGYWVSGHTYVCKGYWGSGHTYVCQGYWVSGHTYVCKGYWVSGHTYVCKGVLGEWSYICVSGVLPLILRFSIMICSGVVNCSVVFRVFHILSFVYFNKLKVLLYSQLMFQV
jgi:hypothetical protein